MRFKIILRYFFLILAIATMVYVFFMSSQTAAVSTKSSGRVIETIAKILIKDFESLSPENKIEIIRMYQGIVRKTAHFAIFACLGFWVGGYLLTYTMPTQKLKTIYSILFCLVYAVSDEIHQLFVAGRSCQLSDIIIDLFGALFGILIINLLYFLFKKFFFARKVANQ